MKHTDKHGYVIVYLQRREDCVTSPAVAGELALIVTETDGRVGGRATVLGFILRNGESEQVRGTSREAGLSAAQRCSGSHVYAERQRTGTNILV